MGKVRATQDIKIEYGYAADMTAEARTALDDEFYTLLCEKYPGIGWDGGEGVMEGSETADGWFSLGVRYTSNGDGYPDEYEIEYDVWEDELLTICKKFEEQHEGFEFDKCSCEESLFEPDYPDPDYYDEDYWDDVRKGLLDD